MARRSSRTPVPSWLRPLAWRLAPPAPLLLLLPLILRLDLPHPALDELGRRFILRRLRRGERPLGPLGSHQPLDLHAQHARPARPCRGIIFLGHAPPGVRPNVPAAWSVVRSAPGSRRPSTRLLSPTRRARH